MKKFLIFLIILFAIGFILPLASSLALDTLISTVNVEAKDRFPMPYECIEWCSGSTITATFYTHGCSGKDDGWFYRPIISEGQKRVIIIEWNGECLVLKLTGYGKSSGLLYRRTK